MDKGEKQVWIHNRDVAEVVGLPQKEFVKSLAHLRRLFFVGLGQFRFVPQSEADYQNNVRVWKFVHGEGNALHSQHFFDSIQTELVFTVTMPRWLWLFLRHTSEERMMHPGVLLMAHSYITCPESRPLLETYSLREMHREMLDVVNHYFAELKDFCVEEHEPRHYEWKLYMEDRFHQAFVDYVGDSIVYDFITRITNASNFFEEDPEWAAHGVTLKGYGISHTDYQVLETQHPYSVYEMKKDQEQPLQMMVKWLVEVCSLDESLRFPDWSDGRPCPLEKN